MAVGQVAAWRVFGSIGLEGLKTATGKLKSFMTAGRGTASIMGMTVNVTRALGAAVGATAAAVSAAAIPAFASFQDRLTESTAILEDMTEMMRGDMRRAALNVARTTEFSAEQAAEGLYFLESAGLDAKQSIEALPTVARFAQAGMFDLATASELLTDAQTALGLSSENATENMENMRRVADVLVKATTDANATTEQFATALTNRFAAALRSVNKPLEEGVALLQVFADQGRKGRRAGTFGARLIRRLAQSAAENRQEFEEMGIIDQQGNLEDFSNIVEAITKDLEGMSDAQKAARLEQLGFTARVQAVIKPLLGLSDAIREYRQANRQAHGKTMDVAKRQLDDLVSQLKLLWGSIKSGLIIWGKFVSEILFLEEIIRGTKGLIDAFLDPFLSKAEPASEAANQLRNRFGTVEEKLEEMGMTGEETTLKIEDVFNTGEEVAGLPGATPVQDDLQGMAEDADKTSKKYKELQKQIKETQSIRSRGIPIPSAAGDGGARPGNTGMDKPGPEEQQQKEAERLREMREGALEAQREIMSMSPLQRARDLRERFFSQADDLEDPIKAKEVAQAVRQARAPLIEYEKALQRIEIQSRLTADNFDPLQQRIDATEKAIVGLRMNGFAPTSTEVQNLRGELQRLRNEMALRDAPETDVQDPLSTQLPTFERVPPITPTLDVRPNFNFQTRGQFRSFMQSLSFMDVSQLSTEFQDRLRQSLTSTNVQNLPTKAQFRAERVAQQLFPNNAEARKKVTENITGVLESSTQEGSQVAENLARGVGQSLISGIMQGSINGKQILQTALSTIMSFVLGPQGPLFGSPVIGSVAVGHSIMEGMAKGVEQNQSRLEQAINDSTKRAMSAAQANGAGALPGISGPDTPVPQEGAQGMEVKLNLEKMPEPQTPPEREYQQRTLDWLEQKGRQLRDNGAPEFQPPSEYR